MQEPVSDVDLEKERSRLSQTAFIKHISRTFKPTDMIDVYWRAERTNGRLAIGCALIPNESVERVLDRSKWDLRTGDGVPGGCEYNDSEGEPRAEYLRYGTNNGVEPLIIHREFYGMRESYIEISEEFRLFHRLYHDRCTGRYIKIDDTGNETEVIITEPDRVRIRLKEIKQFLAIKEMHLAVYFDTREDSMLDLQSLGVDEGVTETKDALMAYGLAYGSFQGTSRWQSLSSLLGKRLFAPFPKEKSGFWPFAREEPKRHVDFIIDLDGNGDNVVSTSDEDQPSNNVGGNPGQLNYLTPVYFRRRVLDRYYQQPGKYSVEDSYLRCGGLWGMAMDNHHDDYVVAWLGDLGRDLPHEEQLHWKGHNVPPCGGVSKVFFKRQICAEFTDSDQPDIEFQYRFPDLRTRAEARLGWSPFLPLADEDSHCLETLRIPASDEQKEFDELVLALAKVLVDSLNEKELRKQIPADERKGTTGGIGRLQHALSHVGATEYQGHVQFLRDLQDLRSSGSAHRKGSKYEKAARRFKTDTEPLSSVFRGMLVAALSLVGYVRDVVDAGLFDATEGATSE